MTDIDAALLRPLWGLGLLVVAAIGAYVWRRSGALGGWSKAANPHLLEAMAELGHVDERGDKRRLVAAIAVAVITVLALAGPALERREANSFRNLDAVVLVVDVTPAGAQEEIWTQLQTLGRFAVASLGTRPAALVVYAGDAYVATDLTHDHQQLGQTLSLLDAETIPDEGVRPDLGLGLARQILSDAQIIAGDVLLISGGDGLGPELLATAGEMNSSGIRLSVISAADPSDRLAAMARVGGGQVFTPDTAQAMTNWLTQSSRTLLERLDISLIHWRDFGRYLLLFALVPLAYLFGRERT